jgi:hypothetical protein
MSQPQTDVSVKGVLRKRTDEEKISTHFTIFKDQTATSNFEERQLLALEPSHHLEFFLELREEDELSAEEEQESEQLLPAGKNQTRQTGPEENQIRQTGVGQNPLEVPKCLN